MSDALGWPLLAVDFGLVVLIWMTQLIVYPSFRTVDPHRFVAWHRTYTRRITLLVVPLMIGQAGLHAIRLASAPTPASVGAGAAVAAAWVVTFAGAVPCHRALSIDGPSEAVIRRLLRWNGWRTACWTGAFLLSVLAAD
ncbi:MAG: hypothetical protein PVF05_02770 [Gemmatimonadales bacterium]